jgi:hypothetical protein
MHPPRSYPRSSALSPLLVRSFQVLVTTFVFPLIKHSARVREVIDLGVFFYSTLVLMTSILDCSRDDNMTADSSSTKSTEPSVTGGTQTSTSSHGSPAPRNTSSASSSRPRCSTSNPDSSLDGCYPKEGELGSASNRLTFSSLNDGPLSSTSNRDVGFEDRSSSQCRNIELTRTVRGSDGRERLWKECHESADLGIMPLSSFGSALSSMPSTPRSRPEQQPPKTFEDILSKRTSAPGRQAAQAGASWWRRK